ncbi:MAG TPA: response regulator [Anaeromyxobacter sp.]|nr:response regulator [Anaeromyxobacter sp.]
MNTVEYLCVFVRASGDRLRAAERLVLALPHLLERSLIDCELRYQGEAKVLGVYVHLRGEGLAQAKRDRLVFWTARAGGRAVSLENPSPEEEAGVEAVLRSPSRALSGVPAPDLFEEVGRFFTSLGAPAERRRSPTERPLLVMDVGGPGWDGVRWSAPESRLFVGAPLAPPVGDEIPLLVRVPGAEKPLGVRATVAAVRTVSAAAPGAPAGYTLRLENPPPALLEALARAAPEPGHDSRAAPRFQVNAPVRITPAPPAAQGPVGPAQAPTRAKIEYATEQELAADFVENLSQGGAFVRSSSPQPLGATLELELKLPNGAELHTKAVVAFANANGMGVRFELDPEAEAVLSSAIAHISARPRRALVVDDDELVCRLMAEALRDRGFEVLIASNASDGVATLSEELLALDLLLTDVVMPGMSGEEFVRLIRKTGGEIDLAIVCVTGQALGEGLEQRLERAGADAVLDKALGPDLIAQAADAVLERKRLLGQGG